MYCLKCGKADQEENSYCRDCGEFLIDPLNKLNLFYNFLGVTTPEKQITANLVINFFALLLSVMLLGFLKGYYDAGADKNPPVTTPNIIYFVYAFLVLISLWQIIGIFLAANLRSKFKNAKTNRQSTKEFNTEKIKSVPAAERKTLQTAKLDNLIYPNVTEETTKNLVEKVKRSSQTEQ